MKWVQWSTKAGSNMSLSITALITWGSLRSSLETPPTPHQFLASGGVLLFPSPSLKSPSLPLFSALSSPETPPYAVDRIWLELDSEAVISLLAVPTPGDDWRERDFIQKIKALTDTLDVSFSHTYCEGSSATDYLAGSAYRARYFVLYDVADLPRPLRADYMADAQFFSQREIPSPTLAGLAAPSPLDSSPSSHPVRAPELEVLAFFS
ncbi:neurogenic locus notch homolog protein 1 [Striga asiatica]|uniref:Neurogenic locus notch homolog protein 1 n=1 Tax=Striga asiatica TaxID=4170 RepID=A0A5A7PDL0_STRAF|nr:neurogenic locus notch homolog protein 1 [Striga asiatica]